MVFSTNDSYYHTTAVCLLYVPCFMAKEGVTKMVLTWTVFLPKLNPPQASGGEPTKKPIIAAPWKEGIVRLEVDNDL